MTKLEICRYYPTIAYYSAFNGLEIKHIEYEQDYLYCVSGAWGSDKSYHKLKLYVNRYGCDFIRFRGRKCYLHDFVSLSGTFGGADK